MKAVWFSVLTIVMASWICWAGFDPYTDSVDFVDLRGSDGQMTAPGQQHNVEYYLFSRTESSDYVGPANLGRSGVGVGRMGLNMFRLRMRTSQPGQYRLTLVQAMADPTNEGGRSIAVYVGNDPRPVQVITESNPEGLEARDVTCPLTIAPEDIVDGWTTFRFQGLHYAAGYFKGLRLEDAAGQVVDEINLVNARSDSGKLNEAAQQHRTTMLHSPAAVEEYQPWNFGERGLGLGGEIGMGYAQMTLRAAAGAGSYLVTLRGVRPPEGVSQGAVLQLGFGQPPFLFRRTVNAEDLDEQGSATVQIELGERLVSGYVLTVRLYPITVQPTYVAGLAVEAEDKPATAQLPEDFIGVVVRQVNPYVAFNPYAPPDSLEDAGTVRVEMCRNEFESAVVQIWNYTEQDPLAIEARVATDPASPGALPLDRACIRVLKTVPDRYGEPVYDGLAPVSEVEIPAGQARQVWITINSAGLQPGIRHAELLLQGRAMDKRLPVRVVVWPPQLPKQAPLYVFHWRQAPSGDSRVASLIRQDMQEHWINTFVASGWGGIGKSFNPDGTLERPLDFTKLDRNLDAITEYGGRMALIWLALGHEPAVREYPGRPFNSPVWQKAFRATIRGLRDHMLQKGWDYKQWAVYPFDERLNEDVITVGELIRKVDPQIRIYTDRALTLESMQAAAHVVDIWSPTYWDWRREGGAERLAFARSTGAELWAYDCGSNQRREHPPHSRYRVYLWYAWDLGLSGVSYWKYWGDLTGLVGYPNEVGLDDEQYGPIDSRRFEAWRDGIDDYCYLWLLDRAINAAQTHGAPEEQLDSLRQVSKQAVRAVLEEVTDPTVVYHWRHRLARAITQAQQLSQ